MKTTPFLEIGDGTLKTISKLYDRTEESLCEDVVKLREWMKAQPHLPEILDDGSIKNFLILNKCSIEKTKQGIDSYYTLRSAFPDIYQNINPKLPNIVEIMEIVYWTPLPKPTQEMYRVWVYKVRNKDLVDIMEPHNILGFAINLQEVRLKEDVLYGDVFVFDMDGINLGYLAKLTPSFVAKCLAVYEKVFSTPLKAVYVINTPPFINTLQAIVKSLMKPKLFQRIHFCQDDSILSERIPREILPKDYGGEERSLEELQELVKMKFAHYQKRFDRLDELKIDENLRPRKLENDDILGFHGNFKKLTVD